MASNSTVSNSTAQTGEDSIQSTWTAIRPTLIISASVGFLCLLGFEFFRRDPIVGKYVYDRKRLTQPDRSPPPLMLSRSLWRGRSDEGDENNDNSNNRTCCKVRPAILELVFLNLDKNYIRYSREADEARKEREKRGYYGFCRTGCYHNNCCNGRRLLNSCSADGEDEGFFVDEDGYIFYPGYLQDYSHIYQANPKRSYSPQKSFRKSPSLLPPDLGSNQNDETLSPKWTNTINDLYPDDEDPNKYFATYRPDESLRLRVDSLGNDSCDPENISKEDRSGNKGNINSAFSWEDHQSTGSFHSAKCTEGGESYDELNRTTVETDRKSPVPSSIDGNGCTTSGDGQQSKGNKNKNMDIKVDVNLPISTGTTANSYNHTLGNAEEGNNGIGNEEVPAINSEAKPLKYPYRLKYFFMPPGFRTWTNAFEFLFSFFLLPNWYRWCQKVVSRIPISSPVNGDDINQSSRHDSVHTKNPGKDLTEGEKELLRCAGLDTYLLIRLARFGFDVTFYPFCTACIIVMPIYASLLEASDDGYESLTINRIPDGSNLIYWILVFTVLLYLYIMRRLWIEWEVFIKLRHAFLANGDKSFHNRPTYLKKYRNTCIVECVPNSHRSDCNLNMVFESLFPRQIEHAEMLLDTSKLKDALRKRQTLIEKYDDIDARDRYERWKYATWEKEGKLVGCCNNTVSKPEEPKVRIGGLRSGKKEDAFGYFTNKIKEVDELANEEYGKIVKSRTKQRDNSLLKSPVQEGDDNNSAQFAAKNLYSLFLPSKVRKSLFGEELESVFGTGIVTFKSIAAKQSAVQCNLSGQPYWMITDDAPDPRDLIWSNIGVDRKTLESRNILVQCVLFIGILGWGAIVTFIQKFSLELQKSLFLGALGPAIEGFSKYLPVLITSLVLLWLPQLFLLLALRVIRFKSHSRCDEFVLVWNTSYRLMNIFFTFFNISLWKAIECFRNDPDAFIQVLAKGVIRQSAFLMQLLIVATLQETMLQLVQWRSLIKQAVFRPLVNLNARSRRYLDWLNAAPAFEQSFVFGFFAPVLSYGLMIAMVFAFMAPIMLGVCAAFFWTAAKVHTHNALFVYCQRCEGGGKIFYYWNRIVFITLYCSIVLFSGILALKAHPTTAIAFLFIMVLITFCVDKSMENTFVLNSLHLPISIARIHDEEEVALLKQSHMKPDGGENYMYREPVLNQHNWNSKLSWG